MYIRTLQISAVVLGVLVFACPVFVMASGLSVTPSKLIIDTSNKKTETVLLVKNISHDVSSFEIYPDDMEQMFTIYPKSFLLEGGQSREVTVKIHNTRMSLLQTHISIVSRPAEERSLSFGSGIKIPITIYINNTRTYLPASLLFATPITKIMLGTFISLGVLLMIILISRRLRK